MVSEEERLFEFRTKDKTVVELHPAFFGIALDHLDLIFENTPDDLMTTGQKHRNPVKDNKKLYGENTIKILKTIGWSTKDNFKRHKLFVLFNSEKLILTNERELFLLVEDAFNNCDYVLFQKEHIFNFLYKEVSTNPIHQNLKKEYVTKLTAIKSCLEGYETNDEAVDRKKKRGSVCHRLQNYCSIL